MRVRTLRGQLTDSAEVRRLIVDDGRLTHGYKVTMFYVWGDLVSTNPVHAVLGTQYDMLPSANAGDNRQIAWAGTINADNTPRGGIVDPDHIVNMDLWIQASGASVDEPVNYLIELEPVIMTEDQTILSLIKERSQDDLR